MYIHQLVLLYYLWVNVMVLLWFIIPHHTTPHGDTTQWHHTTPFIASNITGRIMNSVTCNSVTCQPVSMTATNLSAQTSTNEEGMTHDCPKEIIKLNLRKVVSLYFIKIVTNMIFHQTLTIQLMLRHHPITERLFQDAIETGGMMRFKWKEWQV